VADIFISHAQKDLPLIEALVQLIEGGIGIRSTQIFCSSIEEQGIPPGADFKSHIKAELASVRVVISVVTPQYYNSAFCMCELGATWALTKDFIPLLVPPIDYSDLRGSLFGTQALLINDEKKLDVMHSVLETLANPKEKVVRWNSRKAQFLKSLPSILQTLPQVKTLSEQEARKLVAEREEYKVEFEEADAEVATLKKQIAEISQLKDKAKVAEIHQKYSSDFEVFEALVAEARQATAKLPRVVTEALYYSTSHKEFFPKWDEWGDAHVKAVEDGLLQSNESEFWPNPDHPKIKRARTALDNLRIFVDQPPKSFATQYQTKFDDLFDMNTRPFWQRHHLF